MVSLAMDSTLAWCFISPRSEVGDLFLGCVRFLDSALFYVPIFAIDVDVSVGKTSFCCSFCVFSNSAVQVLKELWTSFSGFGTPRATQEL